MIALAILALGAANAAQATEPPACKANGRGIYGRSNVYDVGNPTPHSKCWQMRSGTHDPR